MTRFKITTVVSLPFILFLASAADACIHQNLRIQGAESLQVKAGLTEYLLLPDPAPSDNGVEVIPPLPDLGDLRPTGKTNPDGTQVWGYPPGSDLEGIIEVHVGPNREIIKQIIHPPSEGEIAAHVSRIVETPEQSSRSPSPTQEPIGSSAELFGSPPGF